VYVRISKYKHNTFILSELKSTSTHTHTTPHTQHQQHNQRRGKCKRGLDGAAASWLRGVFNIARARQCQHRIHTESELHTVLTERGAHYVCTLLKSHSFFMCAARTKGIADPLAARLHLCTYKPLSAWTRKLIEKWNIGAAQHTQSGAENGRRKPRPACVIRSHWAVLILVESQAGKGLRLPWCVKKTTGRRVVWCMLFAWVGPLLLINVNAVCA